MNTMKVEQCLWHLCQQEIESGSAILTLSFCNSNMYMSFVIALWISMTGKVLAIISRPLTSVGAWEQIFKDVNFIGNCPEASSLWILPLRSIKQLFKVNGNAMWKVCAWYQHKRKNTLMGFAWPVSCPNTALLAPKSTLPSRYHPLALSRASNGVPCNGLLDVSV